MDGRLDVGAVDVRLNKVVDARRRVGHFAEVLALALGCKVAGVEHRRLRVAADLAVCANVLIYAIRVNVANSLRCGGDEVHACRVRARKIPLACIESGLVILGRNERVSVKEGHRGIEIVRLVGKRVACCETAEVDLLLGAVCIPVEDLLGKVGNVVSCVRLASNVEGGFAVLGELLEPILQEAVRVLRSEEVVCVVVGLCVRVAEANARRRLEPEHVGDLVPRMIVELQRSTVRLNEEGPVLSEEAADGRAAGAAVQPKNKGRRRRVGLCLSKPVEKIASVLLVNIHISRILVKGECSAEAGEAGDFVCCRIPNTFSVYNGHGNGRPKKGKSEQYARRCCLRHLPSIKQLSCFSRYCFPMYSALI
eukprot:Opistho-2@69432